MRVIAGAAKGHRLATPSGRGTRPTSERVREALFSKLQRDLPGARVADLYAGSGALGIEALSRGAASATFVERGRRARKALAENLEHTHLEDDATVLPGDVHRVLREGLPGGPFDIVFLDPPYDIDPDELAAVLHLLPPVLSPDGLVVLEASRRARPPDWGARLTAVETRRYGDTLIYVARRANRGDGRENGEGAAG